MEIFRALNPDICFLIQEHIPVVADTEKTIAAMELMHFMETKADDTCVIVGFDSTGALKGFLYGWTCNNREYTWIENAWAHPTFTKKYVTEVFHLFKQWTTFKGFNRIRMQTKRPKAFMRLHQFTECATIMERII